MLRAIHGIVSDIYKSENRLSVVLDSMVEDLEDAEVQNMM
jgi:hypothetical protein